MTFIGVYVYWVKTPLIRDVYASTHAEFVNQTEYAGVPRSAKNIRFIWSSVSLGGRAHIGRFEAPLEDCKSFGIAEFKVYDDGVHETNSDDLSFVTLTEEPHCPNLSDYGIDHLGWFDVENIKQAITLERDHSHRPFVWIDTQRNVLYTYWTD